MDDGAGHGVGEDDERGSPEGAHGYQDAVVGPQDEAKDVGRYQAHEGDCAAHSDGRAGNEGGSP